MQYQLCMNLTQMGRQQQSTNRSIGRRPRLGSKGESSYPWGPPLVREPGREDSSMPPACVIVTTLLCDKKQGRDPGKQELSRERAFQGEGTVCARAEVDWAKWLAGMDMRPVVTVPLSQSQGFWRHLLPSGAGGSLRDG